MWKKRIIERDCEWTGVNGQHFDTNRYIECIFYSNEFRSYLEFGSDGAVIGGAGGSPETYCRFINATMKKGQKPVTVEEIEAAIEKMKEEIKADTERHRWNPPRP